MTRNFDDDRQVVMPTTKNPAPVPTGPYHITLNDEQLETIMDLLDAASSALASSANFDIGDAEGRKTYGIELGKIHKCESILYTAQTGKA